MNLSAPSPELVSILQAMTQYLVQDIDRARGSDCSLQREQFYPNARKSWVMLSKLAA